MSLLLLFCIAALESRAKKVEGDGCLVASPGGNGTVPTSRKAGSPLRYRAVQAALAPPQNIDTRCSKGTQQARPPWADVGLASGYFSQRLISSSCQLKQGWQPAGWRLQHGRAQQSGDEKVNKYGCHPRGRQRGYSLPPRELCDSLRVPRETLPRFPDQSKQIKRNRVALGLL